LKESSVVSERNLRLICVEVMASQASNRLNVAGVKEQNILVELEGLLAII
jgi:hypothetical protein